MAENGHAPIEVETLIVKPTDGPFAGRTLRMRRYPSARYFIAQQRGTIGAVEFYEEILDAIEEHDLGRDPASLPPAMVADLGEAWVDALKDVALPPETGNG